MCFKGTLLYRAYFFFATAHDACTVKMSEYIHLFLFLIKTFKWTFERSKTLKSTFEMVLKIKCWMVNHFKRIQHVFVALDARKCRVKNLFWNKFHVTPSNMILSFFLKYWLKSARLNGSNISSNIANFANRLSRPLSQFSSIQIFVFLRKIIKVTKFKNKVNLN